MPAMREPAPRPSAIWLMSTVSVSSRTTTSAATMTPITTQVVRARVLMPVPQSLDRSPDSRGWGQGAQPVPHPISVPSTDGRRWIGRVDGLAVQAVGDRRPRLVLVLLDPHLDAAERREERVLAAGDRADDAPHGA